MSTDWQIKTDLNAETGIHTLTVESVNATEPTAFTTTSTLVNGVPYPTSMPQLRYEELDKIVHYRSGDIVVSTYPKCGTTWTEQCVLLLLNNGEKDRLNPATKNVYKPGSHKTGKIWLEPALEQPDLTLVDRMKEEGARVSLQEFEDMPDRRLIKTHAPVQLLLGLSGSSNLRALPEGVKVVIVTRNPLDACVSSYYHAFNPFKQGWPFDAWATAWLSGHIVFGSWFDWVKNWYVAAQDSDNAYFMQYENMKENPHREIEKLAQFLGVEYDSAMIDRVVENSTFDAMKTQSLSEGGDNFGHLRKGVTGDWRNHFKDEQLTQAFKDKYAVEITSVLPGLEPLW